MAAPTAHNGDRSGLALVVIVTGVLITAVDTTIVILALPEIQRALHVGLASVIWVIIGYLLVITLLATQVGRLGDMYGRVRMYETGFVVFIVGSLLCALSWNEASIVVFRVLQGVGGALITANSGAVIADTFPAERRGRAYGFTSVGWSLGAVIGIVLGGLIVTELSWRWVFWINVPIGAAALLLALRVLEDRGTREARRLDLAGMAVLGAGLFGLLWAITELASSPPTGLILGVLAGGVVLLVVFALVERAQAAPMISLSLFRVPTLTPALLASFFQALANFAVLFLVIMYLQGVRGLTPLHASLLLVPGYVLGAVSGPLAGRISDRRGSVLPATLGLAIQVVALIIYSRLGVSTSLAVVVAASIVSGVGAGFFFPANSASIMKAAPAAVFGTASGMLRTFSNVGMVFSFAVAILIASESISRHLAFAIFVGTTSLQGAEAVGFTHGLRYAFYASAGLMVIAAACSATRAGRASRPKRSGRSVPEAVRTNA